MIVYTIHGSR